MVHVRIDGRVTKRAIYLAIGINLDGYKDVLGFWAAENEGAKFWLNVITDLKNRGVQDFLIAYVDGLKGFPEAIATFLPQTQVQLCIVHLVRHSLKHVAEKDRKVVAAALKCIYRAPTEREAFEQLDAFESNWSGRYPLIGKSWRTNWVHIVPFFAFPEDIRRVIYTTNAIESLNYSLRKVIKNRSLFPSDDAVLKFLYLALHKISQRWTRPLQNWQRTLHQFAIHFEGRVPLP